MARAAMRAQPLIAAIERFYQDQGIYPDRLDDLVPAYISTVSSTGMCGYPEFVYARGDEVGRNPTGGYELKVNTSLGLFNWDVFIYWPNRQYPTYTYGGRTQRIGNWAYVHE